MVNIASYETKGGRRWRVRYRKPDGSQTDKRGFKRKLDAENWAAEHVTVAKAHGEYIDPSGGSIAVRPLYEAWMAKKRLAVKPSYYQTLETSWAAHGSAMWDARRIGTITRDEVQRWAASIADGTGTKDGRPRSATVVIRAVDMLAAILDDAVADRRIPSNPARGIAKPRKRRRRHVYLTASELYAVADGARWRRDIVLTLGLCGMRWGELAALRVRDVDLGRHRLHIGASASTVAGRVSCVAVVLQLFHGFENLDGLHGVAFGAVLFGLGDAEPADEVYESVAFTGPHLARDGQRVHGRVCRWGQAGAFGFVADDGHVEGVDVVSDERVPSDERQEFAHRGFAVGCCFDGVVVDAGDLGRLGRDGHAGVDELAECCDRLALAYAYGAEFDDAGGGGVEAGGLDVHGGVVVRDLDLLFPGESGFRVRFGGEYRERRRESKSDGGFANLVADRGIGEQAAYGSAGKDDGEDVPECSFFHESPFNAALVYLSRLSFSRIAVPPTGVSRC